MRNKGDKWAVRTRTAAEPTMPLKKVANGTCTNPVRLSLDISSDDYRWLVTWCQTAAFNLGRTRVSHVWALRALVRILAEDKAMQLRVLDRIAEDNE